MSTQPLGDIPGKHTLQLAVPSHAAATATENVAELIMPFDCKVEAVKFIPCADVTGANTNTTHLNVINRASGAGTTEVANYDLTSGNNLTANTPYGFTVTAFAMSEGEVLALQAEKVGTGLLVPNGTFVAIINGSN